MRILTRERLVEINSVEIMSWGIMYKFNGSIYKVEIPYTMSNVIIDNMLEKGYIDLTMFTIKEEHLG